MNKDNQKEEPISVGELNFNFDNRDLYELCQKLFKEEITLEEFKEKAHDLVNDRL